MKILSLDLETTFLNPINTSQIRIKEIGAVLYDWNLKRPLKMISEFIYEEDHPPSPQELVDLTGITDDMCKEYGISLSSGLHLLSTLMSRADFVLAHNGNSFDKPVLEAEYGRCGYMMPQLHWIDSKTDVPYPSHVKTRKLVHLCAEMGFVNPFAHRALFDALSTLNVVKNFDMEEVIAISKEPTVRLVAEVSFAEKDKAKVLGYYWDGENKQWFKEVKERYVATEKNLATFNVYTREI